MPNFKKNPNAMKPSGFKMKGPSMHSGTKAHKEAIMLNRSMDQSSMLDGKAKSSAFQKKDEGEGKAKSTKKGGMKPTRGMTGYSAEEGAKRRAKFRKGLQETGSKVSKFLRGEKTNEGKKKSTKTEVKLDKNVDVKKETTETPKFGDAFASARKAGKKEFTWKGKRYRTKTKEEK